MTTLPQYNIEPKSVFHDATRCEAFNFAKSEKPTPIWVPGQDHTRVPNIILAQKMPYFDDTFYPKQLKLRGETKADKEYKQVDKQRFSLDQNQNNDCQSDRKAIKRWREKVLLKTDVKRRYNLNKVVSPQFNTPNLKRWRTSYDTEEIGTLIKPQDSPFSPAMPFMSPKEVFETSTQRDQKTTSFIDKGRTFGPDQARILRRNIDLTTKKFVIQNNVYQDVVDKLQTQIDTNFKETNKSKNVSQVTKLSPQTEKYLQTSIDINQLQSANLGSAEKHLGIKFRQSLNHSPIPLSLDENNKLRIQTTVGQIRNRDDYDDKNIREQRAAYMQTSYNRTFCGRDSSRDVQIDRIMRNTLNAGFQTISPLKENKFEYCLDQNVDEDDTPWAHATSQSLKKTNKGKNFDLEMPSTSPSSAQVNFHQTPLDVFPFRNTQKVRNQSTIEKSPQQTKLQLKNGIRNGSQQVSYWAGMRIDGPISPHEKREVYMTKLQTSWFAGGLFGPRTHYGYGRMK